MHSAKLAAIPYGKGRNALQHAENTAHLGVGRPNKTTHTVLRTVCRRGKFSGAGVTGTVHPWADELLCSGVVL